MNDCSSPFNNNEPVATPAETPPSEETAAAALTASTAVERRTKTSCIHQWHMDIQHDDGCTNDMNYPNEWIASKEVSQLMFHDTAQRCCDKFYAGRECVIYDDGGGCQLEAAATSPESGLATEAVAESLVGTSSCVWHPSQTSMGSCIYSNKYPTPWNDPNWKHMYLFDTHEECCLAAHSVLGCMREMDCETPKPTSQPVTTKPTSQPVTTKPTRQLPVTPRPTRKKTSKKPTPQPTNAPTSTYFIDHFSGLCRDAAYVDQPHYITTTFGRYESCCEASFAKAKCLAAMALLEDDNNTTPAPVPITDSPTYLPTQITYYVEHFTGMCVDSIDVPMPHYIVSNTTKQFSDYRDCCKTSFRKEECFAEGPAPPEPTSYPTEEATLDPTYLPSSLPSGQPSLPTARPTGGDCTEDKWGYDAEYVNGCTNNLDSNDDGSTSRSINKGMVVFQSWQECCHRFFSRLRNCRVDDRCRTDTEVVSYLDRRSRTISNDDCESHPMYHPDDVNKDGCTNSLDFPESWINLGKNRESALFYPTVFECCEELYLKKGYDCNIRNVCAVFITDHPTSSPTLLLPSKEEHSDKPTVDITSCLGQPWHPDMANAVVGVIGGCSNDAGYSESWNENPGMLLFDTAEECCNTHLIPYGLKCVIRDTCLANTTIDPRPSNTGSPDGDDLPSSSCESAKWHPTEGFTKCTNDLDYPQNWERANDLMFDGATECCVNVFNYADCAMEDLCASSDVLTSGTSMMPSQEPSLIPTKMSSSKPSTAMPTSEPPTKMPTSKPSSKMPISAPVHKSNPPTNPCIGKKQRKCRAPLCIWDKSQNSCLLVANQQNPSTKPTSPPAGEGTIRSRCTGKSKRRCPEIPGCAWNSSIKSCADNDDGCEGRMYHPRSVEDRTCSNDRDYPEMWDRPGMIAKYLLTSADQCCASFYDDGPCNVVNVCSTLQ